MTDIAEPLPTVAIPSSQLGDLSVRIRRGAEYKWVTIYKGYAEDLKSGKELPNMVSGGYESDMVQNTPFGAGADEAARKAATAAIADLKNKKPIYVGPLKDNKGNVVISKTYDNLDPFLDKMDYLLQGVQGSIT